MQLNRYEDAQPYQFADLWLRELSPEAMRAGSLAEVTVPIGVERPARRSQKVDRVYVGISGQIQFMVDGQTVLLGRVAAQDGHLDLVFSAAPGAGEAPPG